MLGFGVSDLAGLMEKGGGLDRDGYVNPVCRLSRVPCFVVCIVNVVLFAIALEF